MLQLFVKLAKKQGERHAVTRAKERTGASSKDAVSLIKHLEQYLNSLPDEKKRAIQKAFITLPNGHRAAVGKFNNKLVVQTILARHMRLPHGQEIYPLSSKVSA